MGKPLDNGNREWCFAATPRDHIANHNDQGLDPMTLKDP
jgi:hypothetical protein